MDIVFRIDHHGDLRVYVAGLSNLRTNWHDVLEGAHLDQFVHVIVMAPDPNSRYVALERSRVPELNSAVR
jgi:hypothetical protein